jgi:hypothetical protein
MIVLDVLNQELGTSIKLITVGTCELLSSRVSDQGVSPNVTLHQFGIEEALVAYSTS